jgi:hypothetical protein
MINLALLPFSGPFNSLTLQPVNSGCSKLFNSLTLQLLNFFSEPLNSLTLQPFNKVEVS